ncbi:MAG: alpha/beta hydrolase [Myxococcota bacterium]
MSHPFDPKHFDTSRTSEALLGIVDFMEKNIEIAGAQEPTVEAAQKAREDFSDNPMMSAAQTSDRVEERTLPGPAGPLPVRIFRPAGEVRGAMLHIHGGGWVIGEAAMMDVANERRADELGLAIVSVDYRLAPEHPYPAAPDDCEAAALWLAENAKAEFGADPAKILVGGESAGGHLSAVTALRMPRKHGFHFCGANLVYGLYDLSGVPSHAAFDDRKVLLNSTNIDWFTRCFVPDPALLRDPDVSPLYADLSEAPPVLFTVGTLDPLLDHTLFLYPRWVAAGRPAELQVFPGAPHGFDGFPVPEGLEATQVIDAFLARCVA